MTCTECDKPIPLGQAHEINGYKFCEKCCEKIHEQRKPPELYHRIMRPDGTLSGYRKLKAEE